MLSRMRTSPLLLALLGGCKPEDPALSDAHRYLGALAPVLAENGLLARRLLDASATLYNDPTAQSEVKLAWTHDLVPLAEHLRNQADLVDAPPTWDAEHEALIDIWTARSEAYREIAESMHQGDADLWLSARQQADKAKLDEEAWFKEANDRLGPLGLTVDQFP
jgi:hypothetical protein